LWAEPVIALRSARGGQPLAGLPSRPADDPAARDQGIQFKQVTISGREAGRVAWTLRANKVAVARAQDRMVFEGGVTFDRMRTPPPATSSSRVRGGARPRPAAPPTRSVAAPRPAFSVRAERAEVNGQQNHFLFSGSPVTARLLKPDGRTVAGMLTSPSASGSATYNQSGRTLRLAGTAVTGTFGDLKVKAAQVDWIEDTNVIRCAGTVRATHSTGRNERQRPVR
jgi:hypothetical protein